jgi:MoaA/NifB/PqqE/SkfB family radical SAM enzyme
MGDINNPYFCPAPWTSFYVDPSGQVENCCLSSNKLGSVKEQNITAILNGPKNLEIKRQMLAGERVSGCENCYRQSGTNSLQHYFRGEYEKLGADFYRDQNNFQLRYLDLRWNNTCNFACVYCSPGLSSLWAEQRQQVIKMKESKHDLLDHVLTQLENLDTLYLAGGEPLMLKENEKVLEKLYEVNPNCRICVNTNLSLLEGNRVFEQLKRFQRVQWLVSAEDQQRRYEYLRWPGSWETFEKNLRLINSINDHNTSFNMVMMNLNAVTIWDFIDLLRDEFNVDHRSISVNLYNMRDPAGPLAIQRMTDQQRDKVKKRIAQSNYTRILGITNVLDSLEDSRSNHMPAWNGLEYTVDYLQELDQMRGLDSRQIFPEVYEIVDNHPREIATIY